MKVVGDADGLIKLAKAGILELFAHWVELIIGPRVYREAVEQGKTLGYPDAFELERILTASAQPRVRSPRPSAQGNRVARTVDLGAGERETLDLYFRERAAAVLSDDRAFLTALQSHAIPFLTPAAALVLLAERKALTLHEANAALERLRPLIREEQFRVARADLQRRARSKS